MQALSPVCPLIALLLAGTLLGACRTLSKDPKEEATAAETAESAPAEPPVVETILPIGVVHHVDPSGNFVLIRSSRRLQIEPGTALATRGDQGQVVARLEVSPARKGEFLTADILEGLPAVGQTTTMGYTPKPLGGSSPAADLGSPDAIQVLE